MKAPVVKKVSMEKTDVPGHWNSNRILCDYRSVPSVSTMNENVAARASNLAMWAQSLISSFIEFN